MPYDREEFDAQRKRAQRDRERERGRELRPLALAAPPAAALLGDPAWDLFVQRLQAMIEEAEGALEALKDGWSKTYVMDHERLMSEKLQAILLRESVQLLEKIREIPKEIVDEAKQAREVLQDDT